MEEGRERWLFSVITVTTGTEGLKGIQWLFQDSSQQGAELGCLRKPWGCGTQALPEAPAASPSLLQPQVGGPLLGTGERIREKAIRYLVMWGSWNILWSISWIEENQDLERSSFTCIFGSVFIHYNLVLLTGFRQSIQPFLDCSPHVFIPAHNHT